jgi:peptidoglycan/LPS O-acetylase OafA/YrhL
MILTSVKKSSSKVLAGEQSEEAAEISSRVRGDIEGLRALAVLAVVLYHAFPLKLTGGFAGVDIFFVISGYLIGGRLLQDIQAGSFNVREFYVRRARRIFPALLLVLISIWCIGWRVFSAPEFAALGKQIAAAVLFSNNVLLWSQSGYFDPWANDKPLLHLWSLGIEEQFYLLVPVILWASTSGASASIRWVARLGGLSLLTTIFVGNLEYAATFYLLHARFWELACGVVLAQAELRLSTSTGPQTQSGAGSRRDIREILLFSIALVFFAVLQFGLSCAQGGWDSVLLHSASTLAMMVGAATAILADRYTRPDAWNRLRAWALRHRMRLAAASSVAGIVMLCAALTTLRSASWPGAQTLFPVLGATFVIASGRAAGPNRLLAVRPLTFIGGISYPLYLWHWPAIVLWRQLNPDTRAFQMATPLLASFLLAWLTKEFIEQPVRFGKLGLARWRPPPLWPVVAGMVLTGLVGLAVVVSNGLPSRFSPKLRAIAAWSESSPDSDWRVGRCYFMSTSKEFSSECTPVKRAGRPLVLLWGDSHAAHLYAGLADIQSTLDFDIVQWTAAGCPPTITPLAGEEQTCPARRATALKALTVLSPDLVVVAGAWARYQELGRSPDEILRLVDGTIAYLRNKGIKRIVVFGPGPLWNTSLPVDLFRFMARERSDQVPERLGRVADSIRQLDAAMAAQAAAGNIQYVSVLRIFCNSSGCLTTGDKTSQLPDLLFRDRDHLSVSGSRLLIEHSRRELFGAR